MKKTPVIIRGDLEALQQITDEEQLVVSRINHIDKERVGAMKEIAGVLNTEVEALKLMDLVKILERRPAEQAQMQAAYQKLHDIVRRMKAVNGQNRELIESALEMNRMELSIVQAMRSAPETANYTRGAYNDGSLIAASAGRFDAKQ